MSVTYSSDRTAERRQLSSDIWLAPADGKQKPRPWFETPFPRAWRHDLSGRQVGRVRVERVRDRAGLR
jgi:hypothetical protein